MLRAKKVSVLESNSKIFASRNIWGITLTYLFIQIIFYGVATWVPSYLLNAKGYSIMKMGWGCGNAVDRRRLWQSLRGLDFRVGFCMDAVSR